MAAAAPVERMRRFAEFFHGELGFTGNEESYYEPENSYMNRVLDRRRGIPITLSVLYILIGRRVGLPFCGVGMPGHFIVRYDAPEGPIYLDPFGGGQILSVDECASLVEGLGYRFESRFLAEASPLCIVERMVNNLIGIYQQLGDETREKLLARYRELIQHR